MISFHLSSLSLSLHTFPFILLSFFFLPQKVQFPHFLISLFLSLLPIPLSPIHLPTFVFEEEKRRELAPLSPAPENQQTKEDEKEEEEEDEEEEVSHQKVV